DMRNLVQPNWYDVSFNLASLYIMQERFTNALAAFDKVIKQKPGDGKHLKPSIYNKVMILNQLDGQKKYPKLPKLGQIKKPMPIPPLKKQLENAAIAFINLNPGAEEVPAMRYTIAFNYFSYGHYKIALKQFEDLGTQLTKTPQGIAAIETLLGYHLETEHWPELIKLAKMYLANPQVKGKKIRAFIKEHLDYGTYKKGGGK
ncbi:unnamed protein product, partial [marine sediment metagenome]